MSTNTDELKRLAEAATSGGWFEYGNDKQISVCAQPDGRFTYVIPMVKGNQSYRKDAKFIAAANPAAILSLIEEVERLRAKSERLEQEAAQWKMEDAGHKSSLFECYRAVTGGTGEPADWHGSKPVVEYIATLRAEVERLRKDEKGWAQSCADFAISMKASFDSAEAENERLHAELDKALEVIGPFAAEADEWKNSKLPDDYHPASGDDASCGVCGALTGDLNDLHDCEYTLGHLRALAAFTERHKSQGESDE